MLIVHSLRDLQELPPFPTPLGLTLGSFDGVHLGHQFLINQLRSHITTQGTLAVLTFLRHPNEVLQNRPTQTPLCTIQEKITRLQDLKINLLILLDFTPEIAALSYEEFIYMIRKYYPFTTLMLGQGASFGNNRQGNAANVQKLGQNEGFEAIYLEKFKLNNESVSSGVIRTLLSEGKQEEASKLLGF